MTLGQRIKEARLERRLTQQELVGEFITRNMLSKIENDSATPSVRTLEYLASRLGLPPGSFLSDMQPPSRDALDEAEELIEAFPEEFLRRLSSEKARISRDARRLRLMESEFFLTQGDYSRARELLAGDAPEEPCSQHKYYFLLGRLEYESGDLNQARSTLMKAERSAQPGPGLNRIYSLLEQCCLKLGDYENAYRYATLQRGGEL